jgi:hypothetical protein
VSRTNSTLSLTADIRQVRERRSWTMLTKLVPSWAGWSIALLLLATTLGTMALCRAAALGDQIMFRLLERPVEPKATFAADDEAPEQAPAIEQAEAYNAV